MQLITKAFVQITAALLLLAGVSAHAADAADPTGTWTWTMQGRDGGQAREITLKLKKEGDKLTGSMPGRQGGNETQIENGKIDGENISFSVTREFNGNKMTSKYSGKVSADTITGKIESERNGENRSREWTAKRVKEEKKEEKKS
jgi:hypothetical protein